MNYYNEIKNKIIDNEVYSKVKDLVPNPILIRNKNNAEIANAKVLHQLIIDYIMI